jgi:hypothetical protein
VAQKRENLKSLEKHEGNFKTLFVPETVFYKSGNFIKTKNKKNPWSESTSELYRPSDRRLSVTWLSTCADRRCHVVSVTDPSCRISRFSRQEPLLFYQVVPQCVLTRLSAPRSRPTTFFSGSAGNRTRASGSVAKNSDHFKHYVSLVLSISPCTFNKSILKILHSAAQCVLRNVGDVFCNLSLELGKVCWSSLVHNALQMSP